MPSNLQDGYHAQRQYGLQPGLGMLHKNLLFERYREWHREARGMVLAIVVSTKGSTYTKTGDFMLVTDDGEYQGLLSGGCVEGDLALRASEASKAAKGALVTYDLGGEHDDLWGMGAGCEGALEIWLQPLSQSTFASAFAALADAYANGQSASLSVTGSSQDPLWSCVPEISVISEWVVSDGEINGRLAVLAAPQVLICGAGPDVAPFLDLIDSIGWWAHVVDHRPHYAQQYVSSERLRVQECALSDLPNTVDWSRSHAAVVMSHHLESDKRYLAAIADSQHWCYVGLLGPAHRKQKLLDAVPAALRLEPVLHGPAGLQIGGREPASIALSIVAQMHGALAARGLVTTT